MEINFDRKHKGPEPGLIKVNSAALCIPPFVIAGNISILAVYSPILYTPEKEGFTLEKPIQKTGVLQS